jgi:tripartite-type tricarboxylate transporter receptor subunit TctC
LSPTARAQGYPTKPVHILVGFPAGGVTDIVARLIGLRLSERLGQQFLIENRTGAGNSIAAEAVVRAPPDGYTLLLATSSNAINASLYEKLNFNFVRDIAPIASIVEDSLVMEVNPGIPANTFPEFIAYAKANPGKINMGSSGTGTPPHIVGELFKMMTVVNMVHVPYRGSAPALADLLGGQVHLFDPLASSIEHIRAGRLRPLAVTTARLHLMPQTPTVGDFFPGFQASPWLGLCAPTGTPVEIVARLNMEINAALSDQRTRTQFAELGLNVLLGSPADFRRIIADDIEKWAKVVKFSGQAGLIREAVGSNSDYPSHCGRGNSESRRPPDYSGMRQRDPGRHRARSPAIRRPSRLTSIILNSEAPRAAADVRKPDRRLCPERIKTSAVTTDYWRNGHLAALDPIVASPPSGRSAQRPPPTWP